MKKNGLQLQRQTINLDANFNSVFDSDSLSETRLIISRNKSISMYLAVIIACIRNVVCGKVMFSVLSV